METQNKTRELIQEYIHLIDQKGDWQSLIRDDMSFVKEGVETHSKNTYTDWRSEFNSFVKSLKVNELIVEEYRACTTITYNLESPSGQNANCEIAEVLMVENGKIYSSCIFFDTPVWKDFMGQH